MAEIAGPLFGLTVDAPAGEAGALPQGGETVIEFPNNHFGYALTWFGFALLTPVLLAFWVYRQVRPTAEA
jgi:surfeit locus 1 family protein